MAGGGGGGGGAKHGVLNTCRLTTCKGDTMY